MLEVSSHALNQRRVRGIPFSVAVHTNMSHEHLDYHGSFENYKKAKGRLFELCNANKKGLQTGIINADDDTAPFFKNRIKNTLLYGVKKGELKAVNIHTNLNGSTFSVSYKNENYHVNTNLIGEFNIYNALAAVGVGEVLGLSKKQIEAGITSLKSIIGRMTPINQGQNFMVFVDYAITPAALEGILKMASKLKR